MKLPERWIEAAHGVQPKPTEVWQRLKSLTPREVDVLCYVLGGQLNKEIAAELGIAEKTIKVHRGHVMEKLGVQSSGQLLAMVLRVVFDQKMRPDASHLIPPLPHQRKLTSPPAPCA